MSKHFLLVDKGVYDAYKAGYRTLHEVVDYQIWTRVNEIEVGDIFSIQEIHHPPIYFKVKRIFRKKLHDITPEEIEMAGYPDMNVHNINPIVYTDTKEWYRRVWDYLHSFKGEKWRTNPLVIFFALEKEDDNENI